MSDTEMKEMLSRVKAGYTPTLAEATELGVALGIPTEKPMSPEFVRTLFPVEAA